MIIVMASDSTDEHVDGIVRRLEEMGLSGHISRGAERTVIGVIGVGFPHELPEIIEVHARASITSPGSPSRCKLASREFKPTDTIVKVGDVEIGGDELVVMAGPCSVESREQVLETAHAVKAAGARILRGGAFKPRTSPYSFQGLGEKGLELLAEAREQTGLPIITEVMEPGDVPLVARYADILQIGARNMQNFPLLKEAGRSQQAGHAQARAGRHDRRVAASPPSTSWRRSNFQVILCERGIRTFETMVRNTLDLSAVPVVKRLSHLPIIADPSHGTGKWYLVKPMALAVAGGRRARADRRGPPEPGRTRSRTARSR